MYIQEDLSPIREPDPAVLDIQLAFYEIKEVISYGFCSDNEIELILLTEFIFLLNFA